MVACGRVEPVSARAGVGEEAEQGPFAELGGQGAGGWTLSIRASSGGVQSRGGWLVMMAVIFWRRVGGRGGRGFLGV